MKTDVKGSYAQANGINLYYEVHGKGEPLILLHGAIGAIDMFDQTTRQQANGRYGLLNGRGRGAANGHSPP